LSTVPIRIDTVCEPISLTGFVRVDDISTHKGLPILSDIVTINVGSNSLAK